MIGRDKESVDLNPFCSDDGNSNSEVEGYITRNLNASM